MTFTLVARCPDTGQFGIAISSSSPAVAARCAHARAGVGAVASQNVTDPALGPLVLDRLEAGLSAAEALADVVARPGAYRLAADPGGRCRRADRDPYRRPRAWAPWARRGATGRWPRGNLLASPDVPQAMVAAYLAARGPFGDRLIAGLTGGLAAGGEAGPVHSAGLKIVDRLSWPGSTCAWTGTRTIPSVGWPGSGTLYAPQAEDYVRRAEAPDMAPGYGVPGDSR